MRASTCVRPAHALCARMAVVTRGCNVAGQGADGSLGDPTLMLSAAAKLDSDLEQAEVLPLRRHAPSAPCSIDAMLHRCHAPSMPCSTAAMFHRCHVPLTPCSIDAMFHRWPSHQRRRRLHLCSPCSYCLLPCSMALLCDCCIEP